jgi:hypothetical protein
LEIEVVTGISASITFYFMAQFLEQTSRLFLTSSVSRLDKIMSDFEKYIKALEDKKSKKYFMGSQRKRKGGHFRPPTIFRIW